MACVGSRCNGGKTRETHKQSMAKIAGSLKQKKLKKQRNNQNSVRMRCLALRENNAKTVIRDRSARRGASATSPRRCLLITRLHPVERKHKMLQERKHKMSQDVTRCHKKAQVATPATPTPIASGVPVPQPQDLEHAHYWHALQMPTDIDDI